MGHLLAYHITFGVYGCRLHGDERGTVDRRHNLYGDPVLGELPGWVTREKNLVAHTIPVLTPDHRSRVEECIPDICKKGGWLYHVAACQPEHVHALLTADFEGKAVRRWLKTWLSKEMSRVYPEITHWWAEGGSVKHIWDETYFNEVFRYISEQRLTPQK